MKNAKMRAAGAFFLRCWLWRLNKNGIQLGVKVNNNSEGSMRGIKKGRVEDIRGRKEREIVDEN
jgi:hypothetical protein